MTFLYDSLSYTTTHDLELIVKKHMEDCKSGVFQEQAKNNEEALGIPASSNRLGLGMC